MKQPPALTKRLTTMSDRYKTMLSRKKNPDSDPNNGPAVDIMDNNIDAPPKATSDYLANPDIQPIQ
jgi:hypothetical protein